MNLEAANIILKSSVPYVSEASKLHDTQYVCTVQSQNQRRR